MFSPGAFWLQRLFVCYPGSPTSRHSAPAFKLHKTAPRRALNRAPTPVAHSFGQRPSSLMCSLWSPVCAASRMSFSRAVWPRALHTSCALHARHARHGESEFQPPLSREDLGPRQGVPRTNSCSAGFGRRVWPCHKKEMHLQRRGQYTGPASHGRSGGATCRRRVHFGVGHCKRHDDCPSRHSGACYLHA